MRPLPRARTAPLATSTLSALLKLKRAAVALLKRLTLWQPGFSPKGHQWCAMNGHVAPIACASRAFSPPPHKSAVHAESSDRARESRAEQLEGIVAATRCHCPLACRSEAVSPSGPHSRFADAAMQRCRTERRAVSRAARAHATRDLPGTMSLKRRADGHDLSGSSSSTYILVGIRTLQL